MPLGATPPMWPRLRVGSKFFLAVGVLLLLPDTALDGAAHVAEKIRRTVGALSVPGVERDITVNIGIADLLAHALMPADSCQKPTAPCTRPRPQAATALSLQVPSNRTPLRMLHSHQRC